MTPTEQDKELRDKVATIVEYWDFSPLQDEDSRIERLKNEIMQLITADRKRVELEARLDELDYIRQKGQRIVVPGMEDRPVWSDAFRERIAELKAQQEEVCTPTK